MSSSSCSSGFVVAVKSGQPTASRPWRSSRVCQFESQPKEQRLFVSISEDRGPGKDSYFTVSDLLKSADGTQKLRRQAYSDISSALRSFERLYGADKELMDAADHFRRASVLVYRLAYPDKEAVA